MGTSLAVGIAAHTEPVQVERSIVREFVGAIGEQHPAFSDQRYAEQLGYPGLMAPPTFGVVLTMPALERLLHKANIELHRVVHAAQRFTYHRPIFVGDVLACMASVGSLRSFAGNDVLSAQVDIRDAEQTPVVTTEATLVISPPTANAPASKGIALAGRLPQAPPVRGVAAIVEPPRSLMFEDLAVDDQVAGLVAKVRREDLVRYAHASGDHNPIHWDEELASAVGLPGVIAHGMLTMGLAGRAITAWLPDPSVLHLYGVRFVKPVVVPDDDLGADLEITGAVDTVSEHDRQATVALTVTHQGQRILGNAKATIQFP